MVSKRTVLATSGGALATALAGCPGVGGSNGTPVRFDDGALDRPSGDDLELVARERGERDEQGVTLTGEGTVYERPGREGLLLFAEYGVVTDTDWTHTGFRELHDWSDSDVSSSVRSHRSNVVVAGDASAAGRMRNTSGTDSGRWRVKLDPPVSGARRYRFETTVAEASGASTGDTIAVTGSDATFAADELLDDTETELSLAFTFTYGDTDR